MDDSETTTVMKTVDKICTIVAHWGIMMALV